MRSTGFWGEGLPPVPEERLARSYSENGETADLRKRSSHHLFDLGGGELSPRWTTSTPGWRRCAVAASSPRDA
jgi:hypothetical protein